MKCNCMSDFILALAKKDKSITFSFLRFYFWLPPVFPFFLRQVVELPLQLTRLVLRLSHFQLLQRGFFCLELPRVFLFFLLLWVELRAAQLPLSLLPFFQQKLA